MPRAKRSRAHVVLLFPGAAFAVASAAARPALAQAAAPVVHQVLQPGAKIRLLIADTTGLPPGNTIGNQVFARFVAFDSDGGGIVVRFRGGTEFTLPSRGVRRLDVSRGPGFCSASVPNRVACLAAGAGVGYLFGYAVGHVVGQSAKPLRGLPPDLQAQEEADHLASLHRAQRSFSRVGAGIGFGIAFAFGRDRWTRVTGWPSPRS